MSEVERPAYQSVKTKPNIAGGANRLPDSASLLPSGRTRLRKSAMEQLTEMARTAGIPVDKYLTAFGVDPARGLITVTPVQPDDPEGVPLRRYKDSMTLHIGGVFMEFPNLVPSGRRDCTVFTDVDASQRRCLVIGLNTAVVSRKVKRSSSSSSEAGAKAEAKANAETVTEAKTETTEAES